jgi:hypothetical protein
MAEGFFPPVVAELRGNIGDFLAKMGQARGAMSETTGHGASKFDQLATVGKAAFFGLGTAAIGLGGIAIKMADQFEASHARLITAVHNLGENFKSLEGPLGSAEKKMEGFGFTNAEVENAVARLAPATHSTSKAISEMSLAADIARARHMSLEDAAQLLVKVQSGHVALLGRLGLATKDANGHLLSQDAAMKMLAATYGGAAKNNAETFAGKMQGLKAASEDIAKNIGLRLIPMLEAAAKVTLSVIQWFEKHRTVAIALGVVVGGALVVAIGAYVVSMAAAAIATIAATWPILAIIAAVALVAVGIVYLATHWREVWEEIKSLVASAVDWIKGHFYVLVAIVGLPVVALYELYTHWSEIWGLITGVLSTAWGAISNFFTSLPGMILGLLASAGSWLVSVGVSIVQGLWNGLETAAAILWAWYVQLPLRILGLLAAAGSWLVGVGVSILQGLWNGIEQGAVAVWNWYLSLGPRILGLLGAAGSWLVGVGHQIIDGLINGVASAINGIWGFFTSMPGAIIAAVGDLGSVLYNAGRRVIDGLIHGIGDAIPGVSNILSGLTSLIPSWKGPAARDALLLYGNGQLIMQGLVAGIESHVPTLQASLARVTDQIGRLPAGDLMTSRAVLSGASGGSAGPMSAAPVVSGGGAPIVINVYPSPGMNEEQLAEAVRTKFTRLAKVIGPDRLFA